MIKDVALWEAWEADFTRRAPVDFERNMAIMEALYTHAVALNAWGRRAPLDGLESRFELARILNVRRASRETGPGA